jgi:hypothetical protein
MRSLAIVLLSLACLSPVKAQVAMPSGPTPLEYIDAKRLADADEKSVTGAAHDAMLAAQRKLLDEGVVACSLGKPQEDFSGFTIVMALDASGHVQRTWREGGSPLAIQRARPPLGGRRLSRAWRYVRLQRRGRGRAQPVPAAGLRRADRVLARGTPPRRGPAPAPRLRDRDHRLRGRGGAPRLHRRRRVIGRGDVQWMTAGGGILHEEFHSAVRRARRAVRDGAAVGQPAERDKMAAAGYQAIADGADSRVPLPDGAGTVRVIAGDVRRRGAARRAPSRP